MKKRMFSKFSSILQHAVDALAPQLSLQEEFVYHWKAVTSYFIDNKGEKLPVEQTNIPAHLEQMLVILQEEEIASERGMYGPCLEYLLQHKLLETMYTLGRTDYPPGMKQIVLSFFTKLLSRIKQPLLAHVSVYKAVQRLVGSCGEVQAAPTEIEEIQFLCTVCAKIKADPYLVNFFLEMPKSSPDSATNPIVEEPVSGAGNKLFQEFRLVDTLLTLSHSAVTGFDISCTLSQLETVCMKCQILLAGKAKKVSSNILSADIIQRVVKDSRVAVKACEGLILCSSLPEPIAAHCMINSTKFCRDLTQRLVDTYKKLPDCINPSDLENVQAKWGLEVVTEREDQQTFKGKRDLVSFLSWLDYCDQLTGIANPIVAEALSRTVHQRFLVPCIQQSLLQASETGAISATAYLNRCLHTVCSERLLSEFVFFLLGEERHPEIPDCKDSSVRSRLIERCNHVSEEVCLVTLQLFDTLLQKDEEHIFHNLVIRNLATRAYYDSNYYGNCKELPSCVREEFTNIVKQSESYKSNVKEKNVADTAENVFENSCDKTHVLGEAEVSAVEPEDAQLHSVETKLSCDESEPAEGKELIDQEKEILKSDSSVVETDKTHEDSDISDLSSKKSKVKSNTDMGSSINERESEVIADIVDDATTTGISTASAVDYKENLSSSSLSDSQSSRTSSHISQENSENTEGDVEKLEKKTSIIGTEPVKKEVNETGTNDIESPTESQDEFQGESSNTISCTSSDNKTFEDRAALSGELNTPVPEHCLEVHESTDNDHKESSGIDSVIHLPADQSSDHHGVHNVSPRRSRIEVHNIVNCFLTLVPEELKSSYQTSDSGYDMYLRDAHLQYSDVKKACKDWNYPETIVMNKDKDKSDIFYEGDFLHMLLEKLSNLLDQSYPVNLQLTSVISKLALVPHPNLHEFLLDPYLPLMPNVRNLYSVLQKVSHEIKSQLASQPNLSKQLVMVRRQLMSSSPNLTSLRKNVYSWLEGQGQLEAIIILEEFCKELSAIAFIKHHAAVTGDKC